MEEVSFWAAAVPGLGAGAGRLWAFSQGRASAAASPAPRPRGEEGKTSAGRPAQASGTEQGRSKVVSQGNMTSGSRNRPGHSAPSDLPPLLPIALGPAPLRHCATAPPRHRATARLPARYQDTHSPAIPRVRHCPAKSVKSHCRNENVAIGGRHRDLASHWVIGQGGAGRGVVARRRPVGTGISADASDFRKRGPEFE